MARFFAVSQATNSPFHEVLTGAALFRMLTAHRISDLPLLIYSLALYNACHTVQHIQAHLCAKLDRYSYLTMITTIGISYWTFLRKCRDMFAFELISCYSLTLKCHKLFSRKKRMHLSHSVNIMASDVLATQGARASAARVLPFFVQDYSSFSTTRVKLPWWQISGSVKR